MGPGFVDGDPASLPQTAPHLPPEASALSLGPLGAQARLRDQFPGCSFVWARWPL